MRTYPALPSKEELETRRRLRQICDWFAALNFRTELVVVPKKGLPQWAIDEINRQHFNAGDLMAIRNTPHKWTKSDPYKWLWILHRYQNAP
jgi:hypothetical protein